MLLEQRPNFQLQLKTNILIIVTKLINDLTHQKEMQKKLIEEKKKHLLILISLKIIEK